LDDIKASPPRLKRRHYFKDVEPENATALPAEPLVGRNPVGMLRRFQVGTGF
jgi:hypothetical protein